MQATERIASQTGLRCVGNGDIFRELASTAVTLAIKPHRRQSSRSRNAGEELTARPRLIGGRRITPSQSERARTGHNKAAGTGRPAAAHSAASTPCSAAAPEFRRTPPFAGGPAANFGAGEGNRTLVISLEGFCSTIELHPRNNRRTALYGTARYFPAVIASLLPARTLATQNASNVEYYKRSSDTPPLGWDSRSRDCRASPSRGDRP
jgi:hypothetical protein